MNVPHSSTYGIRLGEVDSLHVHLLNSSATRLDNTLQMATIFWWHFSRISFKGRKGARRQCKVDQHQSLVFSLGLLIDLKTERRGTIDYVRFVIFRFQLPAENSRPLQFPTRKSFE
jgi:hypothetical protein